MKKILQNILLIFFGTFIGICSLELIIRFVMPATDSALKFYKTVDSERGKFSKYDKDLGWSGLENKENTFIWADTKHYVSQNKYGYRGKEYDYKRGINDRIVVLGDSFVWGFGVENKDIFTAIMEKKAKPPLEIVNLGVSGYGNDQEYLLWIKEGYKWAPNKVILMLTLFTDFWENSLYVVYDYPKPFFQLTDNGELKLSNVPVPKEKNDFDNIASKKNSMEVHWLHNVISYSELVSNIVNISAKNRSIRNFLESNKIIMPRLGGNDWEYPLYDALSGVKEYKKSWDIMFKILQKLNADVIKRGAELSVVIIPSMVQVYPDLWAEFINHPLRPSDMILDPTIPNKNITDWGKRNNIHVIDLLPGLKDAAKSNPYLYYPINVHWTPAAHEIVADILLSEF